MVRRILGLTSPPADAPVEIVAREQLDGHRRLRIEIACADGDTMPAFLLVPDGARGAPGVVVFHQHASQWHLGKSEVCGLAGDPTQAFGPTLVDAGLVVLAPDAVGFEDRRRTTSGTEPHPDDRDQHERELSYREAGHADRLHGEIVPGGHALTPERSRSITDWVVRTAGEHTQHGL